VGRWVIRELVKRGHKVTNVDRRQVSKPLAPFVYADLTQRDQVQHAFQQVDAVCHLGEIPGLQRNPPEHVYAHNCQAGSIVLQTAADLELRRVVYTSSCQAYGCYGEYQIIPARLPFDETLPLKPQNAYGLAKMANETYAQIVACQQKLSVAIFRLPAVWSWFDEKEPPDHWDWMTRQTGPVYDCATYVHAADVARAYALAIESERKGCEAYHFSAEEVCSGAPLAARLRAHHPDAPLLPSDWPAFKSPMLTDKAKSHFGWKPRWNILDFYRKQFGKDPDCPIKRDEGKRRRRGRWR
jgi:nucleoside-diphosphate-sugar epimerase